MYTQLEQRGMSRPPVNVATLRKMKEEGKPIACLTAYDASYAVLVDAAGTDLVLVGDSLGMVIQGYDTTVPVTVDDVVYHTRAVARGLRRAFLVADMPFMSYANPDQALENSVRMMQEGGAMMIKLEGGEGQIEIVEQERSDLHVALDEGADQHADPGANVDDAVARDLDAQSILELIDELPARESEVIREKLVEGAPFSAIARRRGEDINAVKTRYYRALERIRGRLQHDPREGDPSR